MVTNDDNDDADRVLANGSTERETNFGYHSSPMAALSTSERRGQKSGRDQRGQDRGQTGGARRRAAGRG